MHLLVKKQVLLEINCLVKNHSLMKYFLKLFSHVLNDN